MYRVVISRVSDRPNTRCCEDERPFAQPVYSGGLGKARDAHEIMCFLFCFDGSTAFHYGGARPNLPLHQAPKSMALVNFLFEGKQWNPQGDNPCTRIPHDRERQVVMNMHLRDVTRDDFNLASQRAFAKAGFRTAREFDDVPNGRYVLMVRHCAEGQCP